MSLSFRIFLGEDSRFREPAQVAAYTIKKHASIPVDIRFLDYAELNRVHDFNRAVDPTASTEFSFSRFLVPWLCDYDGRALFLDNDVLCFGDVVELATLEMTHLALRVVKHDHVVKEGATKFGASGTPQASYPKKNWSSVMLMDCGKLCCWAKKVVETAPGARLHRFQDIPDEAVGELPAGWNDLTEKSADCKLLHYTEGGPWFAGCEHVPHAAEWMAARAEWQVSIGRNDTFVPVKL